MRPVVDPTALSPGATLYHSAFGFARVERVEREAVAVSWERAGAHLPERVRFDNLKRVYSVCAADGFFHRALQDPDALRRALHEQPADALVWLLDDLGGPQRLRDVMDWLVGRELFTPKTFVRWWGTTEPAIKADGRITIEGEWIHVRQDEAPRIAQLDPASVASEPEVDLGEGHGDVAPGAGVDTLRTDSFRLSGPVALLDAHPPGPTLGEVGRALARALADAHGQGRVASPSSATAILQPDGAVRLGPPTPLSTRWAEEPSPEADLRAAAVALVEAFSGRPLPTIGDPAAVIPHLRHRAPDLPPSAMAPLLAALRPDPSDRPTAAGWLELWERVLATEARRLASAHSTARIRFGYDSHVGRTKLLTTQVNQDALWVGTRGRHALAVLADGISISDAGRGDQASWIATQAIARLWQSAPEDRLSSVGLMVRALHLANRAICEASLRAAGGDLAGRMPMGTTALVATTEGNRVQLAWLGDSRAYLVGDWGASNLTADDNVSGERYLAWCDRRARAWTPDGHALVRYLGHFDDWNRPAPFPAHHVSFDLLPGERLVLCSDGITDYVAHDEASLADTLAGLARWGDVDEAARALVSAANRAGGGDNATAVVIELDGPLSG